MAHCTSEGKIPAHGETKSLKYEGTDVCLLFLPIQSSTKPKQTLSKPKRCATTNVPAYLPSLGGVSDFTSL